MEKILTDEMVKSAFEHINNRAHESYNHVSENELYNPYIRAAFANAIKELYDIEIGKDLIPSLEEINSIRGKDEVYVIHEQDYDLFWINAVITKDKLEDYIEKYAEINLKDYQDPNRIKSITRLDKKDQQEGEHGVLWQIEYTDEYLKKVYDHYLIHNHTLEELKEQRKQYTHIGFYYNTIKINDFRF